MKRAARLPERLLHPWRRRRARERLAEVAPGSRTVLFVCFGNICRSPFAERVFEASIPASVREKISVRSTGFYPEEGRSPPREAVRAAAKLGVEVSDHRSRSIASGLEAADEKKDVMPLVFVMDPGQREEYRREAAVPPRAVFVLGDFDPGPVDRRGIRDPFGQDPVVFEETFARIRRCVNEVVDRWKTAAGSTT